MEGQKDSEPGRSATARAVALAHLLHQECKNLLELYKERESFLSHHVPEGERLLIFDLCPDTPSFELQVGHAHSALSQCLEMLECLIAREVEELGEEFEGEYETVRNTVKDRLGHLLHSTGALLENGEGVCAPLPEFQCVQHSTIRMYRMVNDLQLMAGWQKVWMRSRDPAAFPTSYGPTGFFWS